MCNSCCPTLGHSTPSHRIRFFFSGNHVEIYGAAFITRQIPSAQQSATQLLPPPPQPPPPLLLLIFLLWSWISLGITISVIHFGRRKTVDSTVTNWSSSATPTRWWEAWRPIPRVRQQTRPLSRFGTLRSILKTKRKPIGRTGKKKKRTVSCPFKPDETK